MSSLTVDPARFIAELQEIRTFGAQGKGVARTAFSPEDIASRQWLAARALEAGLDVRVDDYGNLFGLSRSPGKSLLIGSHSDSQPLGGWLDGIYGVMCGLEIARASVEADGPPVSFVSFQDEEGWFGALTGSAIWSGKTDPQDADQFTNPNGEKLGDVRHCVGNIAEVENIKADRFHSYLESHIEQGPVLDSTGEVIGVVDAIVGFRQMVFTFEGQANHAGTTPMHLRKDAVRAMVSFIASLDEHYKEIVTDNTVWTTGRIEVLPNAPSVVPRVARCSLQIRDADMARIDRMMDLAEKSAARIAMDTGTTFHTGTPLTVEPGPMTGWMVDCLKDAAQKTAPGKWRVMPSGALHDASNTLAVLPTAMLFVPSIGGISHNPGEDTREQDLELGLVTLANAAQRICEAF